VTVTRQFGQNVQKLRSAAKLTQEQLSEFADIDRSFVQKIEAGTSAPTVEVLVRIRRALKCAWSDLLQGLD
jgi:transcriptional regulator with XRE-family HTH domain